MTDCNCPNSAELLVLAFSQTERELCPVHEATEIAKRDAKAEADRWRDVIADVQADHQQRDDLAIRRREKAERDDAVANIHDPLERSLTLLTNTQPLGQSLTSYRSLSGYRLHDNNDGDFAA